MPVSVRPTLRALRLLPADSYASVPVLSTLERARASSDPAERKALLDTLRLAELDQPLLADARDRFAAGTPGPHRAATAAAKRPVYEVRDMSGAGWRGAVTLDKSVGWLVFADRHDRFHSTVATYLKKSDWEPTALDHALAAADAARQKLQDWKAATLEAILDGLSEAAHDPSALPTISTPPDLKGRSCHVRITKVEHDSPAVDPSLAHTSSACLSMTVEVDVPDTGLAQRVVALLQMVHHEDMPLDSAFTRGGSLLVLLVLTHARLAQLSATLASTGGKAPATEVRSQGALHYVDRGRLTGGFVNGTAVLSLCGVWFVPQHDSNANLPVCAACESIEPAAQRLISAVRDQL